MPYEGGNIMADFQLNNLVDSLFNGIDSVLSTKTVVGEPTRIDDTIIVPLVDVTFGMGAGGTKNSGGGIGGKLSPSAVLVIRDGHARLVNIKNQDAITKIVDLIPDIMERKAAKKSGVTDQVVKDAAFPNK